MLSRPSCPTRQDQGHKFQDQDQDHKLQDQGRNQDGSYKDLMHQNQTGCQLPSQEQYRDQDHMHITIYLLADMAEKKQTQ